MEESLKTMQIFTHLTANDVQLQPFPFKRELSMEAYLIENEGVLALDRDTFTDVEIIDAELALKQGRKNTDGRIDILATYSQEYIAIVELKLGELNSFHLSQLEEYLKERNQILSKYPDLKERSQILSKYPNIAPNETAVPKWIGVLVGSSIDASLANKITNGYQTSEGVPIAALTLQRFRSESGNIYVATDTYFKNIAASKNFSKYKFNGKTLGKGRLVLEIIRVYVASHPDISYAELEKVFPKSFQGTRDVFNTVESASQNPARYFLKPDETIQLGDSHIAVSNQWGITHIPNIKKVSNELGFIVEQVNGNG